MKAIKNGQVPPYVCRNRITETSKSVLALTELINRTFLCYAGCSIFTGRYMRRFMNITPSNYSVINNFEGL